MGTTPNTNVIVREQGGQPFYEAKFRHYGRQIKRRIGPAWLERDPSSGGWRARSGRVPDGSYSERAAIVPPPGSRASMLTEAADRDRIEQERRTRGVTFREVAHAYLGWLENVRGAKPSTLRDHESILAEPGVAYRRGSGTTKGYVMAGLGDRPASKITTREVEDVLATVSASSASPRTVNKYRCVASAVFNYGRKPSTFALPANPASDADRRRERHPDALVFYTPEEVEAVARALAAGEHRDPSRPAMTGGETAARRADDEQDAELVRRRLPIRRTAPRQPVAERLGSSVFKVEEELAKRSIEIDIRTQLLGGFHVQVSHLGQSRYKLNSDSVDSASEIRLVRRSKLTDDNAVRVRHALRSCLVALGRNHHTNCWRCAGATWIFATGGPR